MTSEMTPERATEIMEMVLSSSEDEASLSSGKYLIFHENLQAWEEKGKENVVFQAPAGNNPITPEAGSPATDNSHVTPSVYERADREDGLFSH